VVYYKKGGLVGCGCKKKEEGGQVTKAGLGSAVERFKNRAKQKIEEAKAKVDPEANTTYDPKLGKHRKMTQAEIDKTKKNQQDARQGKGEGTPQHKCGAKIKKEQGGVVAEFKKARCGSKLKKHL